MSGPGVIEGEAEGTCQLCEKRAETRPYGPNGEEVCFDCGMKNERATEKSFAQYVCGMSPEEAEEWVRNKYDG